MEQAYKLKKGLNESSFDSYFSYISTSDMPYRVFATERDEANEGSLMKLVLRLL